MKLLLATGLYPPEIGGPATYAKLLVDKLPSLGIEVELLPFSSVRHLPKLVRHIAYFLRAYGAARGVDIVFVQDTVSTGLPAMLAARLRGKPLLLRVPGDYAWEQGRQRFGVTDGIDTFQHKRYGLRVALARAVQNTVARSAALVIVPSKYFGGIVAQWGVPQGRIRAIYNSIGEISAEAPADAPQGRTIVTVGRLVPWKGFAYLIDLLPRLPEWNLVVIGEGPQRDALRAKAREAGVEARVRFTGALPRPKVFGWYGAADVFVLNSSFESFSFQVAEALAFGVPIIATNIGSLPELVENGREGVLVKPDDGDALAEAIESVTSRPDAWRARVEAGKRKAELFKPEHMLEQFVGACKEIV